MVHDIEQYLRETFTTQAEGAPHIGGLAEAARRTHHARRRRHATTAGASLAVLLVAGGLTAVLAPPWGRPTANTDRLASAATGDQPGLSPGSWTSCQTRTDDEIARGNAAPAEQLISEVRVRPDFPAVAAVICDVTYEWVTNDRVITRSVERRGTDTAALMAALQLPDAPRTTDQCATDRPFLPWIVLLDHDGRWVKPRYPDSGRCAHPRPEVLAAVQHLPTRTVATTIVDGSSADATLTGHLFMVGGPAPGLRRSIAGTVVATGPGGEHPVTVGRDGAYLLNLPSGTYALAGTMGQIKCGPATAVTVTRGTTRVADAYCSVD